MCSELSPSVKVTRVQGLFPSRDEHERLAHQLPGLEDEFRKQGFMLLAFAGLGPSVVFSRAPVTTWDELKRLRLWRWDLDTVAWQHNRLMGLTVVPTSVESAAAAFDAGKVDGFVALAASALAFQWHSRAPYILPLEFDYLNACLVISLTAWDALSIETQRTLRTAGAKLQQRMELVGREADRTVLQAFVGHTVRTATVPPATRDAFFKAARATSKRAETDGHVPADAVQWVQSHLAAH
jgi:TRAP-type C4-dicarboxylate transport system substrate-binding protein